MTLHMVQPLRQFPWLTHYYSEDGDTYQCVTQRGQGRCYCGRYRLCDPEAGMCVDDCGCACHHPVGEQG